MPYTIHNVPGAVWRRAHQRSQRFAENIREALPASWQDRQVSESGSDGKQAQGDGDKQVFLSRSEGGDASFARHQHKPLATPRAARAELARSDQPTSSPRPLPELARTSEELANLAARRAFRDTMVEAYGEEAAGAVFAHHGVTFKGEGKFAPLDAAQREMLWQSVPDRTRQAHEGAYQLLAQMHYDGERGLEHSEDYGIVVEVLRREVEAHPKFGKEFLSERNIRRVVCSALSKVRSMRRRLNNEANFEEFLRPQAGRHHTRPSEFYNFVQRYQARHPQHVRTSEADVASLKEKFRGYSDPGRCTFYSDAGRFLEQEYPNFSRERLEMFAAQRDRVYLLLLPVVPKELARFIAMMVWAVFQREAYPGLSAAIPGASR